MKFVELKKNKSALQGVIQQAVAHYTQQQQFDSYNREQNVSTLIGMVEWLKTNRIPNLQRERVKIDWLYKINIKLAKFIRSPNFEDIILMRLSLIHI